MLATLLTSLSTLTFWAGGPTMTTPTPLLRAKIAAGTVAAVTLASVLTGSEN